MSLYVCDRCHTVENTALGNYWIAQRHWGPALCSECDSGEWHGRFEKRKATREELTEHARSFVQTAGMRAVLGGGT